MKKEQYNLLSQIQKQLEEQSQLLQKIVNNNSPDRHINAREAAEYVGISERLFNERLKLRTWTAFRVGRRRVFRKSELKLDLDAFKENSRYRKGGGTK
jgi:hypothetical protein